MRHVLSLKIATCMVLTFSGCGEGGFFSQNKEETVSRPIPRVDRGVYSVQIPAESDFSYEIVTDFDNDLEGAKVTFLPGALTVDATIQVTKGDVLLSPLVLHDLGIKGNHQSIPSGVTVWVGASHPDALQKDMVVELPVPLGEHSGDLGVIYHQGTPKTGYRIGLYTSRNKLLELNEGYVSVRVPSFGSYQVVVLSSTQKKAASLGEVRTQRPVLNIDEAIALPALAWSVSLEPQDAAEDRGVRVLFSLEGGAPKECFGFVYPSTSDAWTQVVASLDQAVVIWPPEDVVEHVRYILVECLLEDGRQIFTETMTPYSFDALQVRFLDLKENHEETNVKLSFSSSGVQDYRYQLFLEKTECAEPIGVWQNKSIVEFDMTDVKTNVTLCVQGRGVYGYIQDVQSFQWHQGIQGALWTDDVVDISATAGGSFSYLVRASDPESSSLPTFSWDESLSTCDDSLFTVSIGESSGRLLGVAKNSATGTCSVVVVSKSLGYERQRSYTVVVQ
ncbi:MAG: hypothetical protein AB8C84_01900 [Oligoflexales bacterium]